MLPAFSPIIVHTLVCHACGQKLRHKFERTANGKLIGIVYYCLTEGCLYKTDGSFEYAKSQVTGIPAKDVAAVLREFNLDGPIKAERPSEHLAKPPQRKHEHGYRTDEVAKPSTVPAETEVKA